MHFNTHIMQSTNQELDLYNREEKTELVDLDQQSFTGGTTKILHHLAHYSNQSTSSGGVSPFEDPTICGACGYDIKDRYILKVMSDSFHEQCLRCVACQQSLAGSQTCFTKDGHVYCREDHSVLFGRRCGRCRISLSANDMVYRCIHTTYHAHCFSCYYCNRMFTKGDEYIIMNGEIVCRADFEMLCSQAAMHPMGPVMPPHGMFDMDGDVNRKTPKRPRTILNAQQRRQFKAAFEKSAKPCRKVREQLAKETMLSVRVVQVWFQNQRAKMKKMQRKEEKRGGDSEGKSVEGKSSDEEADSECDDIEPDSLTDDKLSVELSNPIDKLYYMTNNFQYAS